MKGSPYLISLMLWLTLASNLRGYPQTIGKYKFCKSCHVNPQGGGGGPLSDYGRSMAEGLMATFAEKGKSKEFGRTSVKWMDIGGDYRHTSIRTDRFEDDFHMLTEGEVALHVDRFTFDASFGVYGRTREFSSRRHFVMFSPTNYSAIQLGRFMPAYGIMTTDHSLRIKSLFGLSRGDEIYGVQAWYVHDKSWQVFASHGSPNFILDSRDTGLYEARPVENSISRLRLSYVGVKKLELGVNMMRDCEEYSGGVFAKFSLVKDQYAMMEYGHKESLGVLYARTGFYVYRGIDLFADYELTRETSIDTVRSVGVSWMVFPRVEFDGKLSFDDDNKQRAMGTLHLWL